MNLNVLFFIFFVLLVDNGEELFRLQVVEFNEDKLVSILGFNYKIKQIKFVSFVFVEFSQVFVKQFFLLILFRYQVSFSSLSVVFIMNRFFMFGFLFQRFYDFYRFMMFFFFLGMGFLFFRLLYLFLVSRSMFLM